ncbi:hypothetical protein [Alteribacillus sp. HJP-4]|uniref:hypothetical protein n=1 Tax=Alteribacillus sp. HJP-4 TaxID=2775394 RepID=UPI0035CCF6BB
MIVRSQQVFLKEEERIEFVDIIPAGSPFPRGLSSTNPVSAKLRQNGFSDGADLLGVAAFRSSIEEQTP